MRVFVFLDMIQSVVDSLKGPKSMTSYLVISRPGRGKEKI